MDGPLTPLREIVGTPRIIAHPYLGDAAQALHQVGLTTHAHTHWIDEDWSVERKTLMGNHIDRWHGPRETFTKDGSSV